MFFLHTISKCSSGWLIYNSLHFESCNSSCIFRGLSLGIIEISWDCDNSSINFFTKISFGSLFHFHQNKSSNLRRGVIFTFNLDPSVSTRVPYDFVGHVFSIMLDGWIIESSSDESLGGKDCIFGVGDSLSLGCSSDKSFTFISKGNNRWSSSSTFGILNNFRYATFHNGNTRVSGSQIDTDDHTSFFGGETSQQRVSEYASYHLLIFLIKKQYQSYYIQDNYIQLISNNKSYSLDFISILTRLTKFLDLIILINMATAHNDGFFATQIAQKGADDPEEAQESPKQKQKQPIKQDPKSLKSLLMLFNSYDTQQKGFISVEQAKKILQQKAIPTDKFDVHYKISMPNQNGLIAFDEFLFVFGLCEDTSLDVEHKYDLCRKVDKRLIQFLRLLNNYRKKSEAQGSYNEAKKSKSKIQQIRERELQRRKKYLGILHEHQISQLEEKQRTHFQQFCRTWDQFMMDYEKTAADLIQKLQQKHENELKEFETKTRDELASKIRFSKQIIELEAKQKTLVKLQQYGKAEIIKKEVQDLKQEEMQKKQKTDEESVEARCANLKKQQLAAVSSLLQNIQKDRNDQIKQRKQDSQKLIIRNKSLITQINHRHAEAIKKIYEALHNMSIDTERVKTQKKYGGTN